MKQTPQQANRLRLLKQAIDRAMARTLARGRKRSVHKMAAWSNLNPPLAHSIDTMFTAISGRHNVPRSLDYINQVHAHIIREAFSHMYTSEECRLYAERLLLADLHKNGGEYELLAQMPQPKRCYTQKPALSPVEARAARTARKVAEWERKLKLAKTKLKKYRSRAKRYAKKGVGANA